MSYYDSFACGISDPDNEEIIITGGEHPATNRVSVYSENGWQRDLASLNQGRNYHACGSYRNGGKKVNQIVLDISYMRTTTSLSQCLLLVLTLFWATALAGGI